METFSALLAFERGIHRSPVNSPHKGQWRKALMFSLICTWINSWVNNREAGDLRRYRVHHDVIVMNCVIICHTMVKRCLSCSLQPIISVGRLFNCISFRVLFTSHCHSNPIDDAIYMYSAALLSIDLPCHPMNLLHQKLKGYILIVRWVRFSSSVCMNTNTKLAPVTLVSVVLTVLSIYSG